ncbi:hypothetical protein [Micromonospora zamorensis]|uniref:hypothetical protein n=1 Tax=Micromonospora zamorensis TaxID=709883 RepID=UPI0037920259
MAFDLARIQSLEQAVAAARQALAAAPPPQVPAAEASLDRALAALSAAWNAYQAEVLVTADQLLATAKTTEVLGLFPVALEAKLEPAQHRLRLRVWPEPITQSSHDPALTPAEEDAGRRFWNADAAATTDAAHLAAWQTLAGALGPPRAAWVARTLTPTNVAALAPGVVPIFPAVTHEDPANPFVPTAAMLPDRWVVIGYRAGARVVVHVGPPVVQPLITGLDTTASEVAQIQNVDGRPIQLPRRMRWMADFASAVAAGMAMEIPVPNDLDQIDQLYVFGVRSGGAAPGRADLETLLTGHRYGRGLAFVPQNTPTNNSPSGQAGRPTAAKAIDQAFTLERKPRTYNAALASNGRRAAGALGIAPEVLAPASFSGATPRIYMEPDGYEPDISRAMQTLLWMPVIGHFLEDLLGLDAARVDALRTHFLDNVSAAGPVPAIRVGDQPYAILPVTALHAFKATAAENMEPNLLTLIRTIPHVMDGTHAVAGRPGEILTFTGRPTTFVEALMAPGTPLFSEWVSDAHWLNEHSGGALPATWADGVLSKLDGDYNWPTDGGIFDMDKIPPRGLGDAATPAELQTLAAARPDAIRAAAPQSSVLSRIARYTTLLEWAQFARTAGEATLQGTAFLDGARSAAAANRAVWLDLLLYCFNPAGQPPVPIDAPTTQKIVASVVSLDAPPRTCPGQPRLAAFRAALTTLAQVPAARLDDFAYPVLTLGHTRHDAWQISLATHRLNSLRKTTPFGTVAGGFGWLLNVRSTQSAPAFTAEFIHAPSHDQAAAAAVLRSAALRADRADSGHADIDLSSRRVRLAHWLVNGVRNGRTLKELLGARFERRLVEAGGGALLPRLRRDFPGGLSSGILDGLALRAAPPAIADAAFAAALTELDSSFDALADALTAEAVYQLVRGNPAGALVDLDDIVRGEVPPQLQVTESPKLGTRITYRVATLMPAGQAAPGWPVVHTPRADADPLLDAWCGHVLGPAAGTIVTVDGTKDGQPVAVPVGLDRLGAGAVDVVAATANAAAELSARILAQARAQRPGLAAASVRADLVWKDLLRLGTRMARLIARAEPLTTDSLALPSAPSATSGGDGDLPARVAVAQTRLERLRDALVPAGASATLLREAAGFGIVLASVPMDVPPGADNQDALRAAVRGRLAAAAARAEPRDRLRALLGDGILGLVAVTAPDPTVLATAATAPQTTFAGVDVTSCASWLMSMGRLRPDLTLLADVLAMAEITGRATGPALRVAQAPFVADDPWIALQWTNPRLKAPAAGRLSLLLHAPAGVVANRPLGGFLVDTWADAVPPPKRDTGLAVHNNGPNSRAPQALLLAVAPDTGVPVWTTDMLAATLKDTLDTLIMRQSHLLLYNPMIHLGHRSDGAGISYELAGSGGPVT